MTTVSSTVTLKWVDSNFMVGADSRGRTVTIGSKADEHGEWMGLKASDLLLLAAASCSTYDVVNILRKQREPFIAVDVQCSGDQNSTPPYAFVRIHLHYIIRGRVNPDRVEKAIKLSEEKYCSVIASLNQCVQITSDYEVVDVEDA